MHLIPSLFWMPTKISQSMIRPHMHVVVPRQDAVCLVRADIFEQMRGTAEEFDPRETYSFVDE